MKHQRRVGDYLSSINQYIHKFKQEITASFCHWIDGSFITQKLNPNDIDLLIFLDYDLYADKEKSLELFRGMSVKYNLGIDAFFLKVFPENHPDYSITLFDKADWLEIFGHTRRDKEYRRHPKGIIQIQS